MGGRGGGAGANSEIRFEFSEPRIIEDDIKTIS